MRGFVALEDVSIIIPIAVAIILFFSALAWSISTIQSTNESVDLTLKVVDIADVFTSPGVITKSSFQQACDSAVTLAEGYGFMVYVTSPDDPAPADEACSWNPDTQPICKPSSLFDCSTYTNLGKRTTVVTRAFPIPYQENRDGLPYNDVNLLVVTIWKGA